MCMKFHIIFPKIKKKKTNFQIHIWRRSYRGKRRYKYMNPPANSFPSHVSLPVWRVGRVDLKLRYILTFYFSYEGSVKFTDFEQRDFLAFKLFYERVQIDDWWK